MASREVPAQAGGALPRMWGRCESSLARALTSGRNVHSICFRFKAPTAARTPWRPSPSKPPR
eukprot:2776983-Pyramimonas_sp.AAC.1